MASKWKIECVKCGKKESFEDTADISQSKWQILAWNVGTSEPICLCNKCEYKDLNKKSK